MIASRAVRAAAVAVLVAWLCVGLAGVQAASAAPVACSSCSAWWHLLSVARPTNLNAGSGTDEVQRLTVKATTGEYVAGNPEDYIAQLLELLEGKRTTVTAATVLPFDASAGEVQKALASAYPERAVQVQEEAPGGEHEHVYRVVFPSQSVGPVLAEANGLDVSFLGAEKLKLPGECVEGEPESCGAASVTEVSKGEASEDELILTAENVGDATAVGSTIMDALPKGLRAVSISGGVAEGQAEHLRDLVAIPCQLEGPAGGSCKLEGIYSSNGVERATKVVPPFDVIRVRIGVLVEGARSGEENRVSIAGGEGFLCKAASGSSVRFTDSSCTTEVSKEEEEKGLHGSFARASTEPIAGAASEYPVAIGAGPAPFGVEAYGLANEETGGAADVQAGSHPFQQTTSITFNTAFNTSTASAGVTPQTAALPKDVNLLWPPGLIGNPVPFPRCTLAQFFTKSCPAQSIVGVATTEVVEPGFGAGLLDTYAPLYDVEPAPGEAARFGFIVAAAPVFVDATVRTGGDYGVTVHAENVTQTVTFLSSAVTVWGVPGEAAHDGARGEGCLKEARGVSSQEVEGEGYAPCQPLDEADPLPFLTLPSACTGPLETKAETDSWQEPKPEGEQVALKSSMPALDGCNRLPFSPSITVTPDVAAASTPTGLTVDEHVPQESTLDAAGLAESDVKGLSVTLPEGMQINPSAGDGLLSCSEEQVGLHTPAASACPEAAKVATVKVKTPVLENPLEGAAYIATQNENPFGTLMAMYIYAEEPVSGVRIKSAGEVRENPTTGQLTAHFERDPAFEGAPETSQFLPQAPFEDVELHFFGGERAPLATPARCGAYTTTGSFVPWSADPSDEAAVTVHSSSTFDITSGPHASACPGQSLPFSPSLTGGTININAGAFSPLTTTIAREDGEQNLGQVQIHMPEGVEGLLAGVKLCPEAQANNGTCPPESLIGETTVSAGVGSEPVAVKGGRVYITEAYDGAPFGLSIVNPVKAGPFDLEHDTANPASNDPACDCLIVRARIEINALSGELTVTTNKESEGHAIPHIIDGIPVQIKRVNVTINRPDFAFNPTSCDPLAMTGTITSDENTASPFAVPFQAANCALLKFEPKLTVSSGGHASKANGASLKFKIAYPHGAIGSNAWLSEAKFDIPKQLPARLTTLQKACLASVFETDRPACPPASIIGHAVVHTQVLPVPLEGPLYFVSFGSAKFPDAVLVLKGYGVTIEQRGETLIDKKTGVTSATFRSIPDVPFETLEVTVPTGHFSEFGVNLPTKDNDNFCGQKLTMPTLFKAANGLEIHQDTPIQITGCTKKPGKHKTKKHTTHKKH
ncbi:MAG: hypothetical protein ABSG93_20625 [Solirubrobacteraceae bacterium]